LGGETASKKGEKIVISRTGTESRYEKKNSPSEQTKKGPDLIRPSPKARGARGEGTPDEEEARVRAADHFGTKRGDASKGGEKSF